MGFAELLLIAVIGLLVIGPKRLPETIRSVALFVGRLRRMMTSARSEFEKEFGVDDIRRQLHNEQVLTSLQLDDKPAKEQPKPPSESTTNTPETNQGSSSETASGK